MKRNKDWNERVKFTQRSSVGLQQQEWLHE
jgi:hypothetical protein